MGREREAVEQTIVSSQSRLRGKSILLVYIYIKNLQAFWSASTLLEGFDLPVANPL